MANRWQIGGVPRAVHFARIHLVRLTARHRVDDVDRAALGDGPGGAGGRGVHFGGRGKTEQPTSVRGLLTSTWGSYELRLLEALPTLPREGHGRHRLNRWGWGGVRGGEHVVEIIAGKGGYAPASRPHRQHFSARRGERCREGVLVLTTLDQLCLAAADCGILCGYPWVR